MRVMVIIKATPSSESGALPSEAMMAEMGAYNEELVKAGILLAGEGLHPTRRAKRVIVKGASRTVVDGPFESVGQLVAGFWIWKVASMDEAVEWVKRCPNPMPDDPQAEIEIRPIFEADDFGDAFTPELREQEDRLREAIERQHGG